MTVKSLTSSREHQFHLLLPTISTFTRRLDFLHKHYRHPKKQEMQEKTKHLLWRRTHVSQSHCHVARLPVQQKTPSRRQPDQHTVHLRQVPYWPLFSVTQEPPQPGRVQSRRQSRMETNGAPINWRSIDFRWATMPLISTVESEAQAAENEANPVMNDAMACARRKGNEHLIYTVTIQGQKIELKWSPGLLLERTVHARS